MVPIQKQRIEYVSLEDIHPHPGNPRRNDQAVQAVANCISEFGFRSPIIVDADGTIIAGHTRYRAAQSLGFAAVPVVYATDLTPEQVNAYRLADNKTAELSEWDAKLLAMELDGLAGIDMEAFGFDDSDLQMPEAFEEPVSLDEVREAEPDDSAPDRVKAGELWRMGDLVLDPFAGSGTTVMACEQLNRRAAVMELDPHYASVIVERWERLTGKTAVRADG